uniref:Uncharacterized protein n=1 Tax=Ditylum brightwellii TaxID=49249 RepID=A0A7S4SVU6_9STRA
MMENTTESPIMENTTESPKMTYKTQVSHGESMTENCSSDSSLSSKESIVDSQGGTEVLLVPKAVNVLSSKPLRSRSILSARTHEESIRENPSYIEGARSRRLERRKSSLAADLVEGSPNQESLSVSFSRVDIRLFTIDIGDNPSVSSGPPLTISWDHFDEHHVDIDEFESHHPADRNRLALLVPYKERWRRLVESGLTDDEIFEATKKVNTDRYDRAVTIDNLEGSKMEEKVELVKRWVRGVTNKKQKRKEKNMIKEILEKDRMERAKRLAMDVYQ